MMNKELETNEIKNNIVSLTDEDLHMVTGGEKTKSQRDVKLPLIGRFY